MEPDFNSRPLTRLGTTTFFLYGLKSQKACEPPCEFSNAGPVNLCGPHVKFVKPPAFQFYPDDFLGGTMHFTDAELGLYMRLLCVQWSAGSLPDDDCELSSYGKGRTSIARVKQKFEKGGDGMLRNARMETERAKQLAFREKQAAYGRQGGRPSKGYEKGSLSKPLANPNPSQSPPSPSPSPSPIKTIAKPAAPRADNEVFDALCWAEGSNPLQIGAQGGRIGRCLKQIRVSSPEVTPQEIKRRANNYKTHFKDATLSADALAKWWARCDLGGKAERQEAQVRFV